MVYLIHVPIGVSHGGVSQTERSPECPGRFTQSGRIREGKRIDKSLIYKMLNNRVYLGEIKHKEQWYKGEHSPIIDKPLWD